MPHKYVLVEVVNVCVRWSITATRSNTDTYTRANNNEASSQLCVCSWLVKWMSRACLLTNYRICVCLLALTHFRSAHIENGDTLTQYVKSDRIDLRTSLTTRTKKISSPLSISIVLLLLYGCLSPLLVLFDADMVFSCEPFRTMTFFYVCHQTHTLTRQTSAHDWKKDRKSTWNKIFYMENSI